MTHSESYYDMYQLTLLSQLWTIFCSIKTHQTWHMDKQVTCVKPITYNMSHVQESLNRMTLQS